MPDIDFKLSKTSNSSKTFWPFLDIEIPAPYSLIDGNFSNIIHGIFCFFKTMPRVNPEIPAPIIAI